MRRRSAVGVLLVAALTVALGACSLLPFGSDTSTPTGETASADLERYYTQVLTWRSCGDGMQCSAAAVPLDWEDPAGEAIELALVRHKATGERLGSLLVNPGGPGGSGFDMVRDSLDFAVGVPLQQSYDIVGFDPRGVAQSEPITCYDAAGMDELLYTDSVGEPGSEEFFAEQLTVSTDFYAACRDNTGPLIDHVDTVSAARDMDLMRAILGDEQLNFLGYSYGTLLGATYAELYPENVGRLVLDGAVDPAASDTESTISQASGFESAFDAYLADCLGADGCPLSGTPAQGKDQVRALLESVHEDPIPAPDGRLLNEAVLSTALFQALYSPDYWDLLSQMLGNVQVGVTDEAFLLADFYNGRGEDGQYVDNSTEAFVNISCLDLHGPLDFPAMDAEAAQLAEVAPLLGKYFSYGGTLCSVFEGESKGLNRAVSAAGSNPILVLGTTNDPATPYAQAVALADQLENGHLVTYNGEGHTAYNKTNDCVDSAVEDFLVDGTVPTEDPDC